MIGQQILTGMNMANVISRITRSARPVPAEYRSNFIHLYFDIGWWGVLNGTILSFLSIYATRLGASERQIGFISAAPALITMLVALPAGAWLMSRRIGLTVFWTSIAFRSFYLVIALLPLLFKDMPAAQVWMIIGITLVMSVPGTALQVGFNALFGAAVPTEWRGTVAGIRNATFAVATTATTLIVGQILNRVAFPNNYQIVFFMGVAGGFMSSLHLFFVKPLDDESELATKAPGTIVGTRFSVEQRFRQWLQATFRMDILRSPFRRVLLLMGFFHLSWYMPSPLFPVFQVNEIGLTDRNISLGSALFYTAVFIGSTQLSRFTARKGNRWVTGTGMVLLSLYPFLLPFCSNLGMFLLTSFLGGMAFSLVNGALYNYLLDEVPPTDRPSHLAWFNLVANFAILMASLIGPTVGEWIGLAPALLIFGFFRMMGGAVILRFG